MQPIGFPGGELLEARFVNGAWLAKVYTGVYDITMFLMYGGAATFGRQASRKSHLLPFPASASCAPRCTVVPGSLSRSSTPTLNRVERAIIIYCVPPNFKMTATIVFFFLFFLAAVEDSLVLRHVVFVITGSGEVGELVLKERRSAFLMNCFLNLTLVFYFGLFSFRIILHKYVLSDLPWGCRKFLRTRGQHIRFRFGNADKLNVFQTVHLCMGKGALQAGSMMSNTCSAWTCVYTALT